MKPKRLTDRNARVSARYTRDSQWKFMERVAREGTVWMCPWDKHGRHGRRCAIKSCGSTTFTQHDGKCICGHGHVMNEVTDDGVYVCGLLGSNEFFHWLNTHKDWWERGRWCAKRCAQSIRITDAGREALKNKHLYDDELISGGMVEPGYVVKPWPRKKTA